MKYKVGIVKVCSVFLNKNNTIIGIYKIREGYLWIKCSCLLYGNYHDQDYIKFYSTKWKVMSLMYYKVNIIQIKLATFIYYEKLF